MKIFPLFNLTNSSENLLGIKALFSKMIYLTRIIITWRPIPIKKCLKLAEFFQKYFIVCKIWNYIHTSWNL